MVAACAALSSTWKRLNCKLRLDAASAGLRAAYKEVQSMPRPDAACLEFVNF